MESWAFISEGKGNPSGVVEAGQLTAFQCVSTGVGDIHRGRILKDLGGMEAYQVAIEGEEAFLPHRACVGSPVVADEILVQVTHDATSGKRARVAMNFDIPGLYVALTPFDKRVVVSKRIQNRRHRKRLEALGSRYRNATGMTFRTRSQHLADEDLSEIIENGMKTLAYIEGQKGFLPTPKKLYLNETPLLEFACQQGDRSVVVTTTKRKRQLEEVLGTTTVFRPSFDYTMDPEVADGLRRGMAREIPLETGNLLIDELETLTVIDVNSNQGAYVGSKDAMAMEINRMAMVEAIRQLALRRIGGIVLIDFIRMTESGQNRLIEEMKREILSYRFNPTLLGFTKAGLFEMQIRRKGKSLKELSRLGFFS